MSAVRSLDIKELAREIGVGLISLLVLAYMVSYVTGQQEQSAFAFEITATETVDPTSVVVYGVVCDKATGKPIRGASLVLAEALGDGSYKQLGSTRSASDGTFRIEIANAAQAEYRLIAEAIVDRGTARSAFHVDGTPGSAYGVSVELIEKEYFVLLPLPGY